VSISILEEFEVNIPQCMRLSKLGIGCTGCALVMAIEDGQSKCHPLQTLL